MRKSAIVLLTLARSLLLVVRASRAPKANRVRLAPRAPKVIRVLPVLRE